MTSQDYEEQDAMLADLESQHTNDLEKLHKQIAHWKQRFDDVVEENCMLRAELDELRSKE